MMRRRLEMLQAAASGYELIYDSSSGVVPDSSKWQTIDRYSSAATINYGGTTNDNAVHVVDGKLKVALGHPYCQKAFYPIDHPLADNCYAAVEFTKTGGCKVIGIHLTDGTKSAMGVCNITDSRLGIHTRTSALWQGERLLWTSYRDVNLFEVEKIGDKAFYYLNGALLYTQTTLFNKSSIAIGGAGGGTGSNTLGLVTKRENAIGTGYNDSAASEIFITKMIYRES